MVLQHYSAKVLTICDAVALQHHAASVLQHDPAIVSQLPTAVMLSCYGVIARCSYSVMALSPGEPARAVVSLTALWLIAWPGAFMASAIAMLKDQGM